MKTFKRKISLFNFLVTLFLTSGILIFFVNNIINVNRLVSENNNLQSEINKVADVNNGLRTEIERLTTYDNIKPVAVDKLGLHLAGAKQKKIIIKAD